VNRLLAAPLSRSVRISLAAASPKFGILSERILKTVATIFAERNKGVPDVHAARVRSDCNRNARIWHLRRSGSAVHFLAQTKNSASRIPWAAPRGDWPWRFNGAFVTLLYLAQRSLQYFPERRRTTPAAAGVPEAEEAVLDTADGERVIVWHVPPRGEAPVFLYFHGNGGSLRWRENAAHSFPTAAGL
jgi:hypothetical protein